MNVTRITINRGATNRRSTRATQSGTEGQRRNAVNRRRDARRSTRSSTNSAVITRMRSVADNRRVNRREQQMLGRRLVDDQAIEVDESDESVFLTDNAPENEDESDRDDMPNADESQYELDSFVVADDSDSSNLSDDEIVAGLDFDSDDEDVFSTADTNLGRLYGLNFRRMHERARQRHLRRSDRMLLSMRNGLFRPLSTRITRIIEIQSISDESADESDKINLADESIDPTVIRSSEHGHCTICFEDSPADPQGCLICRQLIGCKKCVMNWYKTGLSKKAKRDEDASNHFQCPLCRHEWEREPEIDSIFVLD